MSQVELMFMKHYAEDKGSQITNLQLITHLFDIWEMF